MRKENIHLKVSAAEKKQLKRTAHQNYMSLSEFIRHATLNGTITKTN